MKNKLKTVLPFSLGIVFTVALVCFIAATPGQEPTEWPAVPVYSTNIHGETYGIAADVPANDPDLISAIGVDGVEGYFRYAEAHPEDGHLNSPDEVAAWQAEHPPGEVRYVNLYDKDGNVIGEMKIGGGVAVEHTRPEGQVPNGRPYGEPTE
ncbi:MAG: hypothetical protein LBQ33_07535 [Oscillospiraceae bacterium]|nr:hypothetical protein [Oscillospiraceae bacterium]